MRLSSIRLTALMLLVAACGGAEPPPSSPPPAPAARVPAAAAAAPAATPEAGAAAEAPAPRTLDAETPLTTPSGATFTGPKGWTVAHRASAIVLEDPNKEVSLTFIERKEQDGAAAIAAAWKQVNPGFARTIRVSQARPGRDGWDAAMSTSYETTAAELRGVWANARRKGDTWYVSLHDGTQSGWGRRGAQASLAYTSFKARGVEEESFRGKTARALDEARLRELDAFIEDSRQRLKIPGVAVAIVQGGKVVFEKGFGVRELGKKDAVTPDTLFRVASMSKPLTSLLMARLVDEGKLSWDTPAAQILPSFAVGDPDLTKRIAMKHTVCACTGLPRQDMETVFDGAGKTAEQLVAGLQAMKPTTAFGETFQYSNRLVAAGGYLAARAAEPKKPLDEAFQAVMMDRIFGPLGMKRTTYDNATAKRTGIASPHALTRRMDPAPIALSDSAPSALPSGGAWSNVRDYARYVLLELSRGKTPEGKQIVSEGNLLERRKPQVKIDDKAAYGLALTVWEQSGVQFVEHSGSLGGYSSDMFFLPEHGVGVVVLSNMGGAGTWFGPLRRKLLELLFDGRPEAAEDLTASLKVREESWLKDLPKVDFEPDRAWLDRLAGTYTNPDLGKVTVKIEGKKAIFDAGEWRSAVGRKREDDGTVKLALTSPPWTWIDLLPKEENGKVTLTLDVPQQKYVFERVSAGK